MQSGDEDHPDAQAPEGENNKHEPNQQQTVDAPAAEESQSDSQWAFNAEDTGPPISTDHRDHPVISPVSWTASEYVAHSKTPGWFLGLGAAILVITGGIYLLTREIVPPVMIIIIGIAFGVFAARQPEVLEFTLDERGLQAGNKFYGYERFKSFSIIEEDATRSILLMPLQRFMPPISVYYDPNDEEKIINIMGSYLPHEDRAHDLIDRFMRKIRF